MKCRRPLVVTDALAAILAFIQPNALAATGIKEALDKEREGRRSGIAGACPASGASASLPFPDLLSLAPPDE
jgi:hypothetical protein